MKILIVGSFSLKDKRRVVKSLLRRVQNEFNVSVAEVGHQERHQIALLGYGLVSADRVLLEKKASLLLDFIASHPEVEVLECPREIDRINFEATQSLETGKYAG